MLKKILEKLNFFHQCKKYGISFFQCPQFMFLILGLLIISLLLLSFALFSRFIEEPRIVALIVLKIAVILLIIAFLVTNSFERLVEANKIKTEFVNILSHQLRAPLSNLKWAVELLMSGRLGKIEREQLEYFKILKENSYRMMELLKDLILVSKIDSFTFFPKKELFSIEDLTKEVIKEYENFAKAANCEIFFYFQKNLPKVVGDRTQLKEVIQRLLDNAIKYSKGKGKIEININKKGKDIYFEIKDNGLGIPKEDQKFIFQKFFRSSNVARYQTQGTGLGLYISKAIIEKLNGKIGFKSKEGKGSIFWFTLPSA